MARVEHNRATGQRSPRVDHGRPPNLQHEVAPAPVRAISPDSPGQRECERYFVGRRLRVAHARDVGVGAAMLHPVHVG